LIPDYPVYPTGTNVLISKIFSPKKLAKILAVFVQTTGRCSKNVIMTLSKIDIFIDRYI
jgi:hypothetical protein